MFIRKFTYDSMLDLISTQAKEILDLHAQVRTLQNDKRLLLNMLKGDPFDIDYPDTKGGNVVNTHLDSIDHTSTYPIQRHNDGTQFFRF